MSMPTLPRGLARCGGSRRVATEPDSLGAHWEPSMDKGLGVGVRGQHSSGGHPHQTAELRPSPLYWPSRSLSNAKRGALSALSSYTLATLSVVAFNLYTALGICTVVTPGSETEADWPQRRLCQDVD